MLTTRRTCNMIHEQKAVIVGIPVHHEPVSVLAPAAYGRQRLLNCETELVHACAVDPLNLVHLYVTHVSYVHLLHFLNHECMSPG
jgi:hypothetical protein